MLDEHSHCFHLAAFWLSIKWLESQIKLSISFVAAWDLLKTHSHLRISPLLSPRLCSINSKIIQKMNWFMSCYQRIYVGKMWGFAFTNLQKFSKLKYFMTREKDIWKRSAFCCRFFSIRWLHKPFRLTQILLAVLICKGMSAEG